MVERTRASRPVDEWGSRARFAHRLAASAVQLLGGTVLGTVVAAAISEPSPHPLLVAYLVCVTFGIAGLIGFMTVSTSSDAAGDTAQDSLATQAVQRELLAEVKALRLELADARRPWWRRGRRAR